jgi:hypothetical protein
MTHVAFEGLLPAWLTVVIAIFGGAIVWRWHFRETRWSRAPWSYVLPTLRASAFGLIVLMLSGPALRREWISGELSRVAILVDESASMELTDGASERTRLQRIAGWMTGSENAPGWLVGQRGSFHLQVLGFGEEEKHHPGQRSLWDSQAAPAAPPISLAFHGVGGRTAIGDALSELIRSSPDPSKQESGGKDWSAVLLLSDGQSNAGISATEVAEQYRKLAIPIYAIGYGQSDEPDDLGILEVDHSRHLLPSDTFQGSVTIKQQLPSGKPYRLSLRQGEQIVWSDTYESDGQSIRKIDVRIPGEKIFGNTVSLPGNRRKAEPIDFGFEIENSGDDAAPSNNRFESSLWGVVKKNRVLVMDRRGRWETRYIKNAFERDPTWDVDSILGSESFDERAFPKTREELSSIDLLVLTMDCIPGMTELQLKWIADHVAEVGSGLVWIDSGRDPPPSVALQGAKEWLPVGFESDLQPVAIRSLGLPGGAWNERVLSFESDAGANRDLWKSFPPPRAARRVLPAAGAEVLVVGVANADQEHPMLVARRHGQGRVVYSANDESWRWRYNVADLYHQRFWNQLAEWTMQAPYAVENDFVALDSGARTCESNESIPVRVRLRNSDGSPMVKARVSAVISNGPNRIDAIPLTENGEGTGLYFGTAGPYPAGRLEVSLEVAGVPEEMLDLKTECIVKPAANLELQALSRNEGLLEQLAQISGGRYWDESQADAVSDVLAGHRTGKIEESQWLLWQSYPWFLTVMALLSAEWFLRKRAGLV